MRRFDAIWADDRLDEVAQDTHRLLPSRLIPAALTAVAVVFALGAPIALGWLGVLACAEGLA
ncbi:MAG TPA: hybrid sensor histidine kinase/response regulator, partial [Caulobacter sp.]|nr:hybrid sensor histidine kinase/response regulator [Caulobacter sp.]